MRRKSREVGSLGIGGSNPIRIQSMTTLPATDVEGSVEECRRLYNAGCELIRISTPRVADASALKNIKSRLLEEGIDLPISADIHFMPQAAMEAALHVEKVRINPGNFADSRSSEKVTDEEPEKALQRIRKKFSPLIDILKRRKTALRIGVNHGSLSERILSRFGNTPLGMVESAMEYLRIADELNFQDIVVSMKSSNPRVMVQSVRMLVNAMNKEGFDCPLHLGVTEAGEGEDGRIRSAVGIGALLADGVGDTIRVSLAEPPENEIPVARELVDIFEYRDYEKKVCGEIKGKRKSREFKNIGGNNPVRIAGENVGAFGAEIPIEFSADGDSEILTLRDDEPISVSKLNIAEYKAVRTILTKPDKSISFVRKVSSLILDLPLILTYEHKRRGDIELCSSVALGAPLIEGIGDAIEIRGESSAEVRHELAISILQNSLTRISRAEIIACPSCGRTLFNLPEVVQEVKKRFSHLKNVKIAVMGCIVNGPGEMADADFGLVGGGKGTVNLYRDGKFVEGPMLIEKAYDRLESLINSRE